ncbi:DUF2867 domain containing protein [Lysobacter dokdonensis DS-58]|uniref:DUF2867 domain containing protein n=1 Tax=Lysobacter dokdonensis DS-58 TaxID=1300345 RepID=A0A0A2WZ73_9GAMM|nr:DUF2867 domain-containing protein [Lysobacter dokdonensis]KGQ18284.1 DUF2867 domain containing protein [Lysobacter dokdonensis DS-58]
MLATTEAVGAFPAVRLQSHAGGLPVEVSLIAQLGIGAGNALIDAANARQRGHAAYIDALDEPSARIADPDFAKGDATSLYTFAVGDGGHPFHRHAGHRVFTAISGSGGTRLRFSTASQSQVDDNPKAFVDALRHVVIPPDCLFTVRFGGGTWHQFQPLKPRSGHPALFALSCHTDELGGDLPADVRALVAANAADIPTLTEVLPDALRAMADAVHPDAVPTITLALDAPPHSLMARACSITRRNIGKVRTHLGRLRAKRSWRTPRAAMPPVVQLDASAAGSLLALHLSERNDHDDAFAMTLPVGAMPARADASLAAILEGFVENSPAGVGVLMRVRNVLVAPLRLRTSPLGCPVSSLLGTNHNGLFADRFPVLDQRVDADGMRAQVVLGADDKHLRFRSCVDVHRHDDGRTTIRLSNRVQVRNGFGRFYMAAIDRVHRRYIAPAMLRAAVAHALTARA